MADINPDESIAEALEGANPGLVTPQTQPSSTEELQRRVEQVEQMERDSRQMQEETRARLKRAEQQLEEMMQIIRSQNPTT